MVQERDYLEWLHLRQLLWPDSSVEEHQQEIRTWLSDLKHYPVFIAEAENKIIGFLEVSIHQENPVMSSSCVAYLEGWYVKIPYRRRGIGRKLLEVAEAWARAQCFSHVLSDTETLNNASVLTHQQLGFKELLRTTGEIIFKKELV
jgi:aminoglycoside 6'-N-acetyltransferase I